MKASLGQLEGEYVLFIKPDNAIELSSIVYKLGLKLSQVVLPEEKRKREKTGPHGFTGSKTCFYCGNEYKVKAVKTKVWRSACRNCMKHYARDRYLYKNGRIEELNRIQLVRNMKEAGIKVSMGK